MSLLNDAKKSLLGATIVASSIVGCSPKASMPVLNAHPTDATTEKLNELVKTNYAGTELKYVNEGDVTRVKNPMFDEDGSQIVIAVKDDSTLNALDLSTEPPVQTVLHYHQLVRENQDVVLGALAKRNEEPMPVLVTPTEEEKKQLNQLLQASTAGKKVNFQDAGTVAVLTQTLLTEEGPVSVGVKDDSTVHFVNETAQKEIVLTQKELFKSNHEVLVQGLEHRNTTKVAPGQKR